MGVDPEVVRALERSLVNEPGNHSLRLHLVDLLLEDAQHAAALGHCELMRREGDGSPALDQRWRAARAGLGLPELEPGQHGGTEASEREALGEGRTPSIEEVADIVRPALTLDDVAGMDEVKERLRRSFLEPLRNQELREAFGQALRSSLLLWGPPGCGKTYLAKALAGELGLFFVHLGIADVLDMWVGSSERNLHEVFEEARAMRPTVLFIDELDALGHKRSRLQTTGTRNVVNQLLLELDGAVADNEGLLVLGATNQPWDIDPALLRPGRFDRQVLVLPPDEVARTAVLQVHLSATPTEAIDLRAVAARTDGYSGADLARVCRYATELALERSVRLGQTSPVNQGDLERGVKDTSPSTNAWLAAAENYVQFSQDPAVYEQLAGYLASRRRRRGR